MIVCCCRCPAIVDSVLDADPFLFTAPARRSSHSRVCVEQCNNSPSLTTTAVWCMCISSSLHPCAWFLQRVYVVSCIPNCYFALYLSTYMSLSLSSSCCCVYCASLPSLFPPLRTFLSPSLSTITESPKPHSSTTITTTIKKNNNLLLIQVTYSCDSWALTYARESFTCSCSWQQLVQ